MANVASIPVWREIGQTPLPTSSDALLPVLVVGAGPIGLTMALDLAHKGHAVTVLNRLDFVSAGSKGICYAKRTLDVWDKLGVGDAMVEKGVVWNLGKVFWGSSPDPIYQFDILPVKGQKMPGFINIQQYHAEELLIVALAKLPNVDIRWGHAVTGIAEHERGVEVSVATGDGDYQISTEWLIACDGSRSTIRDLLGLDFEGRVFEDNFLIADVKLHQDHPAERWFWFDPAFNPGQSALLHKQPDDVWRIDFQLGWNIDREACIKPENVEPMVRRMLGPDISFSREWYSVYTFQCRRMARFVHGRVIFAGDSAHLVSPFGARGANGGVADVYNLGWKLDLILRGQAGPNLLESYNDEAIVMADENILNSTRSTDFLTPKSAVSRALRDAVLELATEFPFARPFVNSGRLSTAVNYGASALSTPDEPGAQWQGVAPGVPALDAPIGDDWLLDRLGGDFVILARGWDGPLPPGVRLVDVGNENLDEAVARRYDLAEGSAYLVRPDQYIAARWRRPTLQALEHAMVRARGG